MHSENPRASFLSVQRLKTDSLNRIDFKEPGTFGLPIRRHVWQTTESYLRMSEKSWRITILLELAIKQTNLRTSKMFSNAWLKKKLRKCFTLLYQLWKHTVFTEQNLRIYTEYLQNNFRNINNYNKETYLQQEKENYSKDCFWNERCKLTASRNTVISCNTKFRIKVSRRAKHEGWKWSTRTSFNLALT